MSVLSDMLAVLDRWSEWKLMRAAPGRLDELEKRVAALEAGLAARPAAEACPQCGAGTLKTMSEKQPAGPLGYAGIRERTLKCTTESCSYETKRLFEPDGSPYRRGQKR